MPKNFLIQFTYYI